MPAVTLNLCIEEGANLQLVVDASGYTGSLAGATAKMEVRAEKAATSPVLLSHTPEVNSTTKQVIVNVPYTELEDLAWRQGYYDVELTISPTERHRVVKGHVTVSPQVTRS